MDGHGVLADLLLCKIGMALMAMSLVGAVLAMSASSVRTAEREELEAVADSIARALRDAAWIPGEVSIDRGLPATNQQFEVIVNGTICGAAQVIRITVAGHDRAERAIMLQEIVNGGEFELRCQCPTGISLTKGGQIYLEMS